MFVVYCHCVLRVCRYVNGADPNRRRLSYKGMGDASVVAPLKHWHLLQGASLLRHLCKLSTHACKVMLQQKPATALLLCRPHLLAHMHV